MYLDSGKLPPEDITCQWLDLRTTTAIYVARCSTHSLPRASRSAQPRSASAGVLLGLVALLTAFAVEGYGLLDRALSEASADFTELGIAYIRFALEHQAHFEVMFRPELLRRDDPELLEASRRSSSHLRAGAANVDSATASDDADALFDHHRTGIAVQQLQKQRIRFML